MAGLPNVSITELNGQLGRVAPAADRVAGLLVWGPNTSGMDIGETFQVFTLDDAEALGFNSLYDSGNDTDAYKQIREFYDRAGNGRELWIHLVNPVTTMTAACDKANNIAKKMLDDAEGAINVWGCARTPDEDYEPTYVGGLDGDVATAQAKAHELCVEYTSQHKPCRALIAGRDFQGTPSALADQRASSYNRTEVVLLSTSATYNSVQYKNASVGFVLGQYMNRQVMRNPGRVKDGDLGLLNAYMSNGTSLKTYESSWNSIHDKGYLFARKFYGKSGWYINDDPSSSPLSDDYSSISSGRTIDKAHRIAYTTFVNEILDDIDIDENGYMAPAVAKDYQKRIEEAIIQQMITLPDEPEISGVRCIINAAQQVSQTDTIQIEKLAIRKKGSAKYIDLNLGFELSSTTT